MVLSKINSIILMVLLLFNAAVAIAFEEEVCKVINNTQGVCGFPAPEDIDVFPGERYLLLSPIVGMDEKNSHYLYVFDTVERLAEPILYQETIQKNDWGENTCTTPPNNKLSPHGVHISQREGGEWQALVVNHDRESVEFFEIIETSSMPKLSWRGCVLMPQKANINDVVGLPNGSFLVSHMFDRGSMSVMSAMNAKIETGYVWRWRPDQGLDVFPQSQGIVPNGLAISLDKKYVFIAETGGQKLRKLSYLTGEELGSVFTGPIDNLSWSTEGLLIATQVSGEKPEDCFSKPGPCLTPFNVISIDPNSLDIKILHEQRGYPMGMASVAVKLNNIIYAGSFKGEQLMKIILSK